MATKPIDTTTSPPAEQEHAATDARFESGLVATIAFGHFVHDIFSSAFLPTLLPLLREKLSLNYAAAGSLVFFLQLPSILNPLIGYVADKVSLRYLVILAPALSATLISGVGLANDYVTLVFLLLCAGLSIAAFHAPAPAMIANISGKRIGTGMSFFMTGGETARTIGPLVAVAGVTWFGLEGIWRLSLIGWLASGFLFVRLRTIAARPDMAGPAVLATFWPNAQRVFPLLIWLVLARVPMLSAITVYLPTYVRDELGRSLWLAAAALTILEGAGAAGAMFTGTLSDRWGRNTMLLVLLSIAPCALFGFLYGPALLAIPLLIVLGLTAITPAPVIMAVVQDEFPHNRAFANGIFLALNFVLRGIGIWLVGALADGLGLSSAFLWSGLLAFLSLPAVWLLPKREIGSVG